MSFTVKAIGEGRYILLVHEGPLTRRDMDDSRDEAIRIMIRRGWNKILVDIRKALLHVNFLEIYNFTVEHKSKLAELAKIAVVADPKDHDKTSFAETVACNRGVQRLTFDNFDQATEWLLSS